MKKLRSILKQRISDKSDNDDPLSYQYEGRFLMPSVSADVAEYVTLSRRDFLIRSSLLISATAASLIIPQSLQAGIQSSTAPRDLLITGNNMAFNGARLDPVSGLYLLGNGQRAYNPSLAAFHSADSLSPFGQGGVNPYAYCLGDPINFFDPSGHYSWAALFSDLFGLGIAILSVVLAVPTGGVSLAIASVAFGLTVASVASNVISEGMQDPDAMSDWKLASNIFGIAASLAGLGKSVTGLAKLGAKGAGKGCFSGMSKIQGETHMISLQAAGKNVFKGVMAKDIGKNFDALGDFLGTVSKSTGVAGSYVSDPKIKRQLKLSSFGLGIAAEVGKIGSSPLVLPRYLKKGQAVMSLENGVRDLLRFYKTTVISGVQKCGGVQHEEPIPF